MQNDTSLIAIVVDKNKIEFEGETHLLTSAASKIFNRMGYNCKQVQGPAYWLYKGETLTTRRFRMKTVM